MPDLANKQIETATELRAKFFFHWAILSGATLTLVIPLLTQIKTTKESITSLCYLKIALVLLMITLVFASIRNFVAAHGFWMTGSFNLKRDKAPDAIERIVKKLNGMKYLQYSLEIISILGYIAALILLYIFIANNLFI